MNHLPLLRAFKEPSKCWLCSTIPSPHVIWEDPISYL